MPGHDFRRARSGWPFATRTLIRPLYRRFKNLYVILAIGPEAQVDPGGFAKAVNQAQQRRVEITE